MVAARAAEMISFSPRLKRPRLRESLRLAVLPISIQTSFTSVKPGPSLVTPANTPPASAGVMDTRHSVACGASSQAFWMSSLMSVQGAGRRGGRAYRRRRRRSVPARCRGVRHGGETSEVQALAAVLPVFLACW